jgi:hypothetical protein
MIAAYTPDHYKQIVAGGREFDLNAPAWSASPA